MTSGGSHVPPELSGLIAFAVIVDVSPGLTEVGLAEQVTCSGLCGADLKQVWPTAQLFDSNGGANRSGRLAIPFLHQFDGAAAAFLLFFADPFRGWPFTCVSSTAVDSSVKVAPAGTM